VSDFFQPPLSVPTEQAEGSDAPPWTGRPQGSPPGEVLSEVVLSSSETATLSIAYLDAYPEGFELEIAAPPSRMTTLVARKIPARTSSGGTGRSSASSATRSLHSYCEWGCNSLMAAEQPTSAAMTGPCRGRSCGRCEGADVEVQVRVALIRDIGSRHCRHPAR
jgi:hypothetical protein